MIPPIILDTEITVFIGVEGSGRVIFLSSHGHNLSENKTRNKPIVRHRDNAKYENNIVDASGCVAVICR